MHKGWLFAVVLSACGGVEAERPPPARLTEPPDDDIAAWEPTERTCDPLLRGRRVETGVETDLAIDGVGFFPVVDGKRLLLTRDGAFTIDFEGRLVSRDGFPLQVFQSKEPQLQDLRLGPSRMLPTATASIRIAGRLDPLAQIVTFDPGDPTNTSNFNTSVTIYDSLGTSADVTVYYNRIGTGTWEFRAMVQDGAVITGGTAGAPAVIAHGRLTFDSQGRLDQVTQQPDFNPLNAVNPQPLHFDFGDELGRGGSGVSGVVQNIGGNRNETTLVEQDGHPGGDLTDIVVRSNGVVVGHYSNERTRELAQLVLARVSSPRLLRHVGGALFAPVGTPGPVLATPGTGLFGTIRSGSVERPCE
ncbi:MAG: flagellar hook-basal body complex protein [Myxococcaceae bacterium]|nr:flagellar hook-basal body complex protein [Myxococcaceae bacterium]